MEVWVIMANDMGYNYLMGIYATYELAEKHVTEMRKKDEDEEYPYDSYQVYAQRIISE